VLYEEKKLIFPPEAHQGIETLLNEYRSKVSDLKLAGKMPVFESKYHLTYEGYRALAHALFTAPPSNPTLFGWPYLLLQWNLIARTATVSTMRVEHVSWEGHALLISTPKHKGDHEAVKCFAVVRLLDRIRAGSTTRMRRWVELSFPRLYSLVEKRRREVRQEREDEQKRQE
jgi:hypothetical protein